MELLERLKNHSRTRGLEVTDVSHEFHRRFVIYRFDFGGKVVGVDWFWDQLLDADLDDAADGVIADLEFTLSRPDIWSR
jgi:hypothetical protein